jgi:hypothetical protein
MAPGQRASNDNDQKELGSDGQFGIDILNEWVAIIWCPKDETSRHVATFDEVGYIPLVADTPSTDIKVAEVGNHRGLTE